MIAYLAPSFLIAFFVTLFLTPIIKKIAIRIGALDKPCPRKIHKHIIPRLGGVSIFLGFIISSLLSLDLNSQIQGILLGSSIILIIGIIDDIKPLNPWLKLAGQIIVACITLSFGVSINFITHPMGNGVLFLDWLSYPITVIWIVGIINTLNLIDGIDGLAAGLSAISSFVFCLVALSLSQYTSAIIMTALFGSCLAFLKYNFSPAQIFMGDSGSMFLGYILATSSIIGVFKSTVTVSLLIPILVLGIPITDTTLAIFRRIKNKQGLFNADKQHIHHQLLQSGLSQKQVALYMYLAAICLGVLALGISISSRLYIVSFTLFILISSIFYFIYRRLKPKIIK